VRSAKLLPILRRNLHLGNLIFLSCGENLQNWSANQNELFISKCSTFSYKDSHTSGTSCETSFYNRKTEMTKKSLKTSGITLTDSGKFFT